MERDVAVREWCIEKVIQLFMLKQDEPYTVENVVTAAKEIEKYVNGIT